MNWHVFDPEEAPRVWTAISRSCEEHRCDECPGVFKLQQTGDEPVFCTCWCHQKGGPRVIVGWIIIIVACAWLVPAGYLAIARMLRWRIRRRR